MTKNNLISESVILGPNDKGERQAGNATQPESSATKSPETVNSQAGGQFAPAPLFGHHIVKIPKGSTYYTYLKDESQLPLYNSMPENHRAIFRPKFYAKES